MRTLVVGAGEIGQWFADVLLRKTETAVVFADVDRATARQAAQRVGGDVMTPTADPESTEGYDLVTVAVPIPAIEETIREYASFVARGGAMVDLAGVMEKPLSVMRERFSDANTAGGDSPEYGSFHPLFAPPRAPGRIAYVAGQTGPQVEKVRDTLAAEGNEVFQTTAAEHDRAMETVQAGAHAAVLAYALAAEDVDPAFETPVSRRLGSLAATVTEGDPSTYADIQATFDGADRVAMAAQSVASSEADRFRELFEQARQQVDATPRNADPGERGPNETG